MRRGLGKFEAKLRLAYLLGALDEPALREALTFDTPADESCLTHLCRLRERMHGFLAARPVLSPAAANLIRGLQVALAADDPVAGLSLPVRG